MLTVDESITITRPRDAVWRYVSDPDNFAVWMNSIIAFTPQGDWGPEVGDRAGQVMKIAGRQVESTKEVTEVVPKEQFSFKTADGPVDEIVSFRLEDDGQGTRLTIHGETPGLGGIFGRLSEPLVTHMFARDLQASLDNLKTLLEELDTSQ